MTRKDYVLIAAALASVRIEDGADHATIDLVADTLAGALRSDNPMFDRARFLAACGVEDGDVGPGAGPRHRIR